MKIHILDKFFLERLEKKGIYKEEKNAFVISGSEARNILHVPKEIMRPVLKSWKDNGLADEKDGKIFISTLWKENPSIGLNTKSKKHL